MNKLSGLDKKIIVTGAAGFIGSNIIRALNARGYRNIVAVDDLTEKDKFKNLVDLKIHEYIDKDLFYQILEKSTEKISHIFHQGACSNTEEHDGKYMMENNYSASKTIVEFCDANSVNLIYASSAATYGNNGFPLNVYGYSKDLLDKNLESFYGKNFGGPKAHQVVGLKYFNVYGYGEAHKGKMASFPYQIYNHVMHNSTPLKLFGSYDGKTAGEQKRDFVYIDDVVDVNMFFFDNPSKSGLFDVGTGNSSTFNELTLETINLIREGLNYSPMSLDALICNRVISYIDFPQHLKGKYQSDTKADLSKLREAGYDREFNDLYSGLGKYITKLLKDYNNEN